MSILIMSILAGIVLAISYGTETIMIKHYKHTHHKRNWKLEGGWKL